MTNVICDLDGVLYKGDSPIQGAAKALQKLIGAGVEVTFVTNNSTRSPGDTALKISDITGVGVAPAQVMTSSQAAAAMLQEPDWPAFTVGEAGVSEALQERGVPTTTDPETANSVVVGMFRGITYDLIAEAADAVRRGARFIATNADPTYPSKERLLPGAGAIVAAIATASGRSPQIAGKPHQPIRRLLADRGLSNCWVVGDRVDTDIALASTDPSWRSVLVLSGVTAAGDDHGDADHVVPDFAEAVALILEER